MTLTERKTALSWRLLTNRALPTLLDLLPRQRVQRPIITHREVAMFVKPRWHCLIIVVLTLAFLAPALAVQGAAQTG